MLLHFLEIKTLPSVYSHIFQLRIHLFNGGQKSHVSTFIYLASHQSVQRGIGVIPRVVR